MKPTIVAIGGGNISPVPEDSQTLEIDREIIRLSKKAHPKLLFIPTASGDARGYIETVEQYFGAGLGCQVTSLLLAAYSPSPKEIARQIFSADIIYVGGGDTRLLLEVWRKTGVDVLLAQAWKQGIILSGLSAGAICWFDNALSDYLMFDDPDASMVFLPTLGFVPLTVSPHFSSEPARRRETKRIITESADATPVLGPVLGIDDACALIISGDEVRVKSATKGAAVHRCFLQEGSYVEEPLPDSCMISSLIP